MLELALLAFSLSFHGRTWPYDTAFVSVMPGASVVFDAVDGPAGKYTFETKDGTAVQTAARRWKWTAPDRPGTYELKVDGPGATVKVHAFVLMPATRVQNGTLNGYRIGAYPAARGAVYRPPPGFIELTRENEDTKVSPHFELKQFLCKQEPVKQYPKYLLLEEPLLLKLEAVLARVRTLGFKADTLYVMSGYRTPLYNKALGDVAYSMHQWGSAADVFVDTHTKGQMDDLNKDRRVDVDDARFLYDEIDAMLMMSMFKRLEGGLGYYPATSAHPPFVHIDARGTRARWGG